MSWISLADEVRAIRFLLDTPIGGPVNLTAPAPVTNAEMAKTLGRVLRRPSFVPVPAFGPKLVFGKEMGDEVVFASQRALPAVLQREGFEFEHPSLEPALRAILGS
jgi:NAD dependent epimerase/dehydratase family enzyme